MEWSREAKEVISRVPFFVRSRVKRRVEQEARSKGASRVLLEHVVTCQRRYLQGMEEEVKGFQVEGCFGRSGCPNRAVIFDGLLEEIEASMKDRDLRAFLKERVGGPLKMHHEVRVSVSDCPNACSRPQIADLGLIGACEPYIDRGSKCSQCMRCVEICRENALRMTESGVRLDVQRCLRCGQCVRVCPTGHLYEGRTGYRLLVGGKLGRHPRLAQELGDLLEHRDDVIQAVKRCVDFYMERCLKGERMGEILERDGTESLEEKIWELTKVKGLKTGEEYTSRESSQGG